LPFTSHGRFDVPVAASSFGTARSVDARRRILGAKKITTGHKGCAHGGNWMRRDA
jgi:hypothetical protein